MMTCRSTAWTDGRRGVHLTAVALTVVLLLASAVVARPVAAGDTAVCATAAGAVQTDGSDQVVGTYDVSPADGAGDITVSVSGYGIYNYAPDTGFFSVTISAAPGPGGVTRIVTQTPERIPGLIENTMNAKVSLTFSSASSFRVIIHGIEGFPGSVTWVVMSNNGGCGASS